MKKIFFSLIALAFGLMLSAQDIPQHISYSRIYDFVDELANDGVIEINSVVKPYSRSFIAEKLLEADAQKERLNKRQVSELAFFLEEFALEQDRLPDFEFPLIEGKKGRLDLMPPMFYYRDKAFRARVQPILGMHILNNDNGQIQQRWFGVDFQAMIGKHVSVYGSLRDISAAGKSKMENPPLYFERLSEPTFLTNYPGYEYKHPSDFSDSRGGVKLGWNWGSVGLVKDNVVWGDNYNGSNIISGRVPSFPMITLNLRPAKWFEMNYIHGWLVSNVVDSAKFYVENDVKRWYRNHNKYIAANMFTFIPIPKLNISFGNSIVYAEDNVQPGYLIPISFFKSVDHTLTKGLGIENQNSQLFFNISSRNIKHLHLYSSVFFDEMKFSRFKSSSPDKNPFSFKVGGKLTNFPIRNLSANVEFTKTNIINYKHSIEAITYASNNYSLGHYLGDNSQELYASLGYKPIRGLDLEVFYLDAKHGNEYNMMKYDENGEKGTVPGVANSYIIKIISQPSLGDVIWSNKSFGFRALYEVFNNAYAVVKIESSDIQGYDATSEAIAGERRMTAEETLNYFTPAFLQGKNTTITVGFSLGF
ncbi:MAG TPA: hypothetical protein GXZ87_09825 [Bacteroidales bacterium]|nr:hypothetical protein [Bacteroidales bacterium]